VNTNAFSGFTGDTLAFLADLAANNTRDWFTANKTVYESAVKRPAGLFCDVMREELEALGGVPLKAKVFRIHRDVRFSKDKTPYNAHLHISFAPAQGAAASPAWMWGLSPDYFSIGCGVFAFDKDTLERFRKQADGPGGATLADLLESLAGGGARIGEPELKRVPAGFPKDHAHADLLRRKGLTAWIDFDDPAQALGPDMVARCRDGYRRLKPLFDRLRAF
jgi:uncharacterized protein (TIGR02453 family)